MDCSLFGLGMLLRQRGNGSITTWGTLIAASGAAAAIAGLGTGEVFGFHILGIAVLAPITSHIPFIGVLNISELTFAQVVKILKVSVAIGIVHLLLAFFLRLHKDIKDGNKDFVWFHDIPNIIQFLAIVSLVLSDYRFSIRYHWNVWSCRSYSYRTCSVVVLHIWSMGNGGYCSKGELFL